MKKQQFLFSAFLVLGIFVLWPRPFSEPQIEPGKAFIPNDWFFMQRSWPLGEIDHGLYRQAQADAKLLTAQNRAGMNSWTPAGPTNITGRLTGVAVDPNRFDTFYVATATGGVFKTTDTGQSWFPIFDDQPSLSIGAIAMDPGDPQTLYVGTGEANGGGGSVSYGGTGVYRTQDGGTTWAHLGLENSYHIGRIAVHPTNSQIVYVAVVGQLFGTNVERGVYRTTDGGTTWENVLFISNQTGCIDIVLDPSNPNRVYAAMWERERAPTFRDYGGPECGIWRSTDGGDNWTEMTNGVPNNSATVGRIGLAISASNPQVLYAIYADNIGFFEGVYKTTDGGDTWSGTNDGALSGLYSSFGWWFGNIRVDPNNSDVVYVLGLDVYRTVNGGNSWSFRSGGMHVDQHGLFVHPSDSDWVLAGNDGGAYLSTNGGATYDHLPGLPITQFYTCEMDFQFPERLYGGTQDNGTNRTLTGNLDDWSRILGGDGFYVLVDPTDNQFIYAESQNGALRRSTNGGASFISATSGINSGDRNNWNSPLEMSPHNPQVLYFGTDRVYKTTNRAANWTAISDDLSNGPGGGNLTFGTVTTISASPLDAQLLYAGTDDGNLWVTSDEGGSWTLISQTLPTRWITRVVAAPDDVDKVFVTISGFREGEPLPHVFRSLDRGSTWESIAGNLPEAPVNDLVVDPEYPQQMYVGTDVGVFRTQNHGVDWSSAGPGMPQVAVSDLKMHVPTRTLLAGTYGRSMYTIEVEALCFGPGDFNQAVNDWGTSRDVIDLLEIMANLCP